MALSRGKKTLSLVFNFLFGLWFLLLPLIYSYRFYNPYEYPKFLWFVGGVWTLAIIAFVFCAFDTSKTKDSSRSKTMDKKSRTKLDKLTLLVLLYVLIVFLADIFGLDPRTSVLGSYWRHQGWLTLASGVLLFLVVRADQQKRNRQDWGWPCRAVFASSFLVALIACWQAARFFIFQDLTVPTYNGRIVGTLGNPNFLGGFLAMSLPLVLISKSRLKPFVLVVSLVVTLLSGSRGAWLALLIVGAVWLGIKKKFRILAGVLFALGLLMLVAVEVQQPGLLSLVSRNSIWENRVLIWQEGLKAVIRRPILGYGQENFELIFPSRYQMKVDNVHNLFLEILLSSGVVGLIVYLAIIAEAFKKASLTIRLCLLVFLIRAQFNPLSIPEIALFWYFLAMTKVYCDRNTFCHIEN